MSDVLTFAALKARIASRLREWSSPAVEYFKRHSKARALPFLNKEAEQEYILRLQRAREPENVRHAKKEMTLTADFSNRGVLQSGMYCSAVLDEKINHFRILTGIARDELFKVIQTREIRLRRADVQAISASLIDSFRRNIKLLESERHAMVAQTGMPAVDDQAFRMRIDQAIHREGVLEVSLRASELRRDSGKKRKDRILKHAAKLFWIFVGAAGAKIVDVLLK